MKLSILYRGPLASCNYDCHYCPFAKRTDSAVQLKRDERALTRFADWLETQTDYSWKLLFTPWGEALVRRWYRETLACLTQVSHIEFVAIQTNLSTDAHWLEASRAEKLALWCAFHPTQAVRPEFVSRVHKYHSRGARVSVGGVGVPEHLADFQALRHELPAEIPMWINAEQPRSRPYRPEEIAAFTELDPRFALTLRRHRSLGGGCQTGETVFTVDGEGEMRRCHFVSEVIGNIYETGWESALRPRPCPNRFCQCFVGLSHFEPLALSESFGDQILARIPL